MVILISSGNKFYSHGPAAKKTPSLVFKCLTLQADNSMVQKMASTVSSQDCSMGDSVLILWVHPMEGFEDKAFTLTLHSTVRQCMKQHSGAMGTQDLVALR